MVAQKMQRIGSSDCRSLCSDQYPSAQFKKVSIGIIAGNPSKMGSLSKKDYVAASLPGTGKTSSCVGNVVEKNQVHLIEENKTPEIVETLEVKQTEEKGQRASGRFSSRSVRHETTTTESVQFHMNPAPIIPSDGVQKKLDTGVHRNRQDRAETSKNMDEVVEELVGATLQEGQVPDKGEEADKVSTCKNETLRMKLREILGTDPSQKKPTVNQQDEEESENLNINHEKEYHRTKLSQAKHNSDTIESDSESPNQTKTRPVTRSLTKRRAPPKTVSKFLGGMSGQKKTLSSLAPASKLNLHETNIFAFDGDGKTEVLRSVGGQSKKINLGINEEENGNGGPKILQGRPLGSQKALHPNPKQKNLSSLDEASLHSKVADISPSQPSEGETDSEYTPNIHQKDRRPPSRKCSRRDIVPEKKWQSNEKATTIGLHDRKSLQSRETESSSIPYQAKKKVLQTSILPRNAEIEGKNKSSIRRALSEKNFLPNEKKQTVPSPDGTSDTSKEVADDSKLSQTDACKDYFGNLPDGDNIENNENVDSPPIGNKTQLREPVMIPVMPNTSYPNLDFSRLPSKITDLLDDFPSPTFAMNASPASPLSGKLLNDLHSSPVLAQDAQERNPPGKDYTSNMLYNSTPRSYGSDANTESSDGSGKTRGLQHTEYQYTKEKNASKNASLSPVEDQETESSEDEDFIRKDGSPQRKSSVLSSDTDSPCKSPHPLHRSKRVKAHLATKVSGAAETTGLSKAKQYPENSLESDVIELATVLERFKAKLKSHTSNTSSEILSTSADKIRLHLHDLESQMRADVGKFINSGKSKRKRFESRLQGQQERLRLLHDKFKEDVDLQIQDCRSTLEELEAHQTELKGTTYKQKASHRKLLLQVEEAMKAELRDAETNIAAIDKEAKKKMHGLKYVLKEWTEDGVIR